MDGNVEVSPSGGFSQIYNSMNSTIANANPLVLIALTVIVLFYFILFSYLGYNPVAQRQEQSPGMKLIRINYVGSINIFSINKWYSILF